MKAKTILIKDFLGKDVALTAREGGMLFKEAKETLNDVDLLALDFTGI